MEALLYAIGLVAVFYLLSIVCDRYFVGSLDIIARKLKLSEDVAGATFMAIGTSAPEFATASLALLKVGSEDIGAGTIIGSAIFNILVIVGASAAVATAYLKWKPVVRDMGFYIVSIIVLMATFWDGRVTLFEAGIYLVAYAVYIVVLAKWSSWFPDGKTVDELGDIAQAVAEEESREERAGGMLGGISWLATSVLALTFPSPKRKDLYIATFCISIAYIIGLSWLLVEFGVGLAHTLGVPEVIIALTILAGGTSVPDMLASVIVARKGRGDMAVSNAVGSNTFDILICLGLPWLVYILVTGREVTVETGNLLSSVLLLCFTVVTMFFVLGIRRFKIGKGSGYFLIGLYVAYLAYAVYGAYYPESFGIDAWVRMLGM